MKPLYLLSVAVLAALPATAVLSATIVDETHEVTPDDGARFDYFGYSVGVSGSTAIVGSYRDDDLGTGSGSIYFYDVTTGHQLTKVVADDGMRGEYLGRSVGISGGVAIAGAPGRSTSAGAAYLFDAATGAQLHKLTAFDGAAGDGFGTGVAISGSYAVVGAYGDDDAGLNSGSAYVYDAATGGFLSKITAADAGENDQFGRAVAISGTTVMVGSHLDDDGAANSGSAYLFDAATGTQLRKLTASDATANAQFGRSVALSDTYAAVGASNAREGGIASGAVYIFDATTGAQIYKLTADDAAAADRFGWTVSLSGNLLAVGAYGDDDNGSLSGSVYLFDLTTGTQIAKIAAGDGAAADFFGAAVGLDGRALVVGAPRNDDAGQDSGSAYFYAISDGGISPVPLPAGIWLLATALGGVVVSRRRRT